MRILSIESSCDDSAMAYTDSTNAKLLWHEKISQESAHSQYGGVVPELASRLFARDLVQLLESFKRQFDLHDISHIAVTYEPGLSTSLLEGMMMAKALALSLRVPLLGINHLKGHIYSLFIEQEAVFPLCVLLVSGGHTLLLECYDYNDMRVIAKTLDDSFGECYDKAAKMLGLGYPGGIIIDSLAQHAMNEGITPVRLPIPLMNNPTCDMSFSGLKNAFRLQLESCDTLRELAQKAQKEQSQSAKKAYQEQILQSSEAKALAAGLQESATTHVIQKCRKYFKNQRAIKHFAIVGGASANTMLRAKAEGLCREFGRELLVSPLRYCSDNAAMIGRAALAKIEYELRVESQLEGESLKVQVDLENGCEAWQNVSAIALDNSFCDKGMQAQKIQREDNSCAQHNIPPLHNTQHHNNQYHATPHKSHAKSAFGNLFALEISPRNTEIEWK